MSQSEAHLYWNDVWDLPGGPVVKNPPARARDVGLIPDWGRFHRPQYN